MSIDADRKLMLTVEEAAELASIGVDTAYQLAASGAWPKVMIGSNRYRIPMDGLRAWIQANTTGGVAAQDVANHVARPAQPHTTIPDRTRRQRG